jgi:hypothetical protein
MKRRRWALIGLGFTVTAPVWLFPLSQELAFSDALTLGESGHVVLFTQFIWQFGLLVALALLMCVPTLMCFRRHRWWAMSGAAVALFFLVSFAGGLAFARRVQHHHLPQNEQRAQPLVDAIVVFEMKNGRPPKTLVELVPDYIDSIPTTGIAVEPRFGYLVAGPEMPMRGGNTWSLSVTVPGVYDTWGCNNWLYLPRQDYEGRGYRRIGVWGCTDY